MRTIESAAELIFEIALGLIGTTLLVYGKPTWGAAFFAMGAFAVAWDVRRTLLNKS